MLSSPLIGVQFQFAHDEPPLLTEMKDISVIHELQIWDLGKANQYVNPKE